jgi:glycine reductase complex component B subunit alpha and beta
MRLEVASYDVRELRFGSRTALDGHTLEIDPQELRRLVLEDAHFAGVALHLAQPGDSVRIVNGLDVIEPRWKAEGPGGVFPGFVSEVTPVGSGRTNRLAGVAVVQVSAPVPGEQTHFREQVLDMSGPGADFSPFGQTRNVVLEFQPSPRFFPPGSEDVKDVLGGGAAAIDYNRAITAASLKVAARLGQASLGLPPDVVETFESPPCSPDLPRTVCLIHAQQPFVYGLRVGLPFGTVLHPNELFDGAVVGWRQAYRCTYWDQNHQVLQELSRRHGRDLNFLGCVLFGDESPTRLEKDRIGLGAAKLAKLIGAEAAVVLGINGSNLAIDTMIAVEACERAGIKTSLIYLDVGLGNDDPGFIHAVPEADAIVSVGTRDRPVELPPMDTVIGGSLITTADDPHGALTLQMRYIHTSSSNQGFSRQTTRFY